MMWAEVCYTHKNGIDQPCVHPEKTHCHGCDVFRWIMRNDAWLSYARAVGKIDTPMTVEVFFEDLPDTEENSVWERKVFPYLVTLFKKE